MTTTYFATDGSYGDADDILVIDTSDWSDDEWDAVRECADSARHDVARQIIENASNGNQLKLEFADDAN